MLPRVRGIARAFGPGLSVAIGIGAVARLLAERLPGFVSEVTVALLLGILVAQLPGMADRLAIGVRFAMHWLLRAGIVLLGARLSLDQVGAIGIPAITVILATMAVAFMTVRYASRAFGVDSTLAVLLAVGAAVCGTSAIVATAPIIRARAQDVAAAVATVTVFGTIAVLAYPPIGRMLGMSPEAFGLWAGVAINDTSQVVATGAAYSPAALDTATVVKLLRNTLMAPVLLGIAWAWGRSNRADHSAGLGLQAFPVFVLGFGVMAGLRTVGLIGLELAQALETVASSLIVVALAGVGLSIRARDLLATSSRPIAVGLCTAALVGGGALLAIEGFGLGQLAGAR